VRKGKEEGRGEGPWQCTERQIWLVIYSINPPGAALSRRTYGRSAYRCPAIDDCLQRLYHEQLTVYISTLFTALPYCPALAPRCIIWLHVDQLSETFNPRQGQHFGCVPRWCHVEANFVRGTTSLLIPDRWISRHAIACHCPRRGHHMCDTTSNPIGCSSWYTSCVYGLTKAGASTGLAATTSHTLWGEVTNRLSGLSAVGYHGSMRAASCWKVCWRQLTGGAWAPPARIVVSRTHSHPRS
jgi:hypothetical protein